MIEQRLQNRQRARWRTAIRHESKPVLFGETLDISIAGASVLADTNIVSGLVVTLYIQIPPKYPEKQIQVIEANARIQYTSFSTAHDRWRMGLQFLEIKKGKEALEKALRQLSNA